jgi:hypothetical protein
MRQRVTAARRRDAGGGHTDQCSTNRRREMQGLADERRSRRRIASRLVRR